MADFYTYRNEVAGKRRKRKLFLVLIVVLVLLCAGVGAFWFGKNEAPAQEPAATPETAVTAAPISTEAPTAEPAAIAEPQRIVPNVDTAAWDKRDAVEQTIDTEYLNTDHRMVAVPMLGTVTNS